MSVQALQTHEQQPVSVAAAPEQHDLQNLLFNPEAMGQIQQLANIMATGKSTVPTHLQGNVGDCMAVIMQSAQWRMNPFAVAQKTHVVQGTLGYEAQLVNAVITTMAPTTERLQYEWFGEWEKILGKFVDKPSKKGGTYKAPGWNPIDEAGLGVKIWATLKGEIEPRELTLLLTQAQTRNSTLWASDPKQQLAYLAIKRWARLYVPDVILGVYTPDEMEQVATAFGEQDVTPQHQPVRANHQNGATGGKVANKLAQRKQKTIQREPVIEVQSEQAVEPEGPTFAQIAPAMHKAATVQELDDVASLIGDHLPEDQVQELRGIYSKCKKAL